VTRELIITRNTIDPKEITAAGASSGAAGAILQFLGIVREREGADKIQALEYECFEEMAQRQFHKLFDHVEKTWPVESVRLIHRVGLVPVNEPSLWVEVVATHRGEAFQACQWIIDEMKRVVPIWKKAIPPKTPATPAA
jgi:molybdopterin synthase catalytic subunit